ncbi:ribonuclease H-like domain-containing protein [Paenibacillus sp. GSMTC-2017]|uniref:ribonuclease H-like domain-containing protein n=1 Tax=Paenibacillus sp. GSMTC-2017 TaxID=2794350 RepID=UPI0018D70378|nr:ribonuclease H-like domain-containing protein [Paenibacillus sp. GSMTC-2017]MBH5317766.1 ribonuclease H-like domain-containing protein [Paenibacillus sp. GSMTC-2017]
MSGLRDRMNRLRGVSKDVVTDPDAIANSLAVKVEEEKIESQEAAEVLHPAWSTFGVELQTTDEGSFLIRKSTFHLGHFHGTHQLGELVEAASGLKAFHPVAGEMNPEQILYLDLETTGLGVGAGNVPFMIGIAYQQADTFIVEQTIIRHPAEEYAMLNNLKRKLRNYTYLATYNGKTFDWPLVQNRIIMNGIRGEAWTPLHLDFLHPSRSLWRNTLASCKLSHIEEERLGISRTEDVPGSLAPQLYFQYLATGDPAPLEGVFIHNESDLLSLACLSIRFGFLLQEQIFNRIPYPEEAEELVRTGLWLEKMGHYHLADTLFERALQSESTLPSALTLLATRDKKAGNWGRAVLLWQKAVKYKGLKDIEDVQEAYIELAMYYEHRVKQVEVALVYAIQALDRREQLFKYERRDKKYRAELDAIQNRIARLRRKLEAKVSTI